jgi:ribose transport system ATP-binding protein
VKSPRFSATTITKRYGSTLALDEVSFEVCPGRIHGLLGGNGSGKSTLIKVVAGVIAADAGGTVAVDDSTATTSQLTPAWAKAHGIAVVHQSGGLFPELSVAENLCVGAGFPVLAGTTIRPRAMRARAAENLARLKIDVDVRSLVGDLGQAERMLVAIARAVSGRGGQHTGLLILDEPTAALPAAEVERLFGLLREYAAAGQSIVIVSHRLDEIRALVDDVTVLRDGRNVLESSIATLTKADLIAAIAGPVQQVGRGCAHTAGGAPVLTTRALCADRLDGVDLDVHTGEVVGIAGLVGSGASELLRVIYGEQRPTSGVMTLAGKQYRPSSTSQAVDRNVGYVVGAGRGRGAFPILSVSDNLAAADLRRYGNAFAVRPGRVRDEATRTVSRFDIRVPAGDPPVSTLSGGNQQKVMLARWLQKNLDLLLLEEPTEGVDVGARAAIHNEVLSSAERGTAVLVASSDLEELAQICDRVVVMQAGVAVDTLYAPLDERTIANAVLGAA